jgi:hypothetical protein
MPHRRCIAKQPTLAPLQYACMPQPKARATILSASASEKSRSSRSCRQATHSCCCCGSDSMAAAFSQLVKASVLVAEASAVTATHGRRCSLAWMQALLLPLFVAVLGRAPACCPSCMVARACTLQVLMTLMCSGEALIPVAHPHRDPSRVEMCKRSYAFSDVNLNCTCVKHPPARCTLSELAPCAERTTSEAWALPAQAVSSVRAQSALISQPYLLVCMHEGGSTLQRTKYKDLPDLSLSCSEPQANCAQRCIYRPAKYKATLLRLCTAVAQHVHCP